ncbi:hypothetical protein CJF30_00004924 [Rutstroemia sp. NJR-2017a BBW]|nr:hypothetical protein CJF30_00004924 [Rutstroemia sp. NJR-2017a BBW]
MALAIALLMRDDSDGYDDDDESDDADTKASLAIGVLYLVFCGLCIILTITEVVMILRRKMQPLTFVIMNLSKSAFWTALFVLNFVVSSRQLYHRPAIVGIVIDVILILAFYIPLIHGSLIYHRYRSGSAYRAVDTKRFSDNPEVVEQSQPSSPQAYKSLANAEVVDDVDLEANTDNTDTPTEMETQTPRRLSYNHIRFVQTGTEEFLGSECGDGDGVTDGGAGEGEGEGDGEE